MPTSTLRKGSQGIPVKELQEALQKKGLSVGTDGIFGAQTELAVIAFQRRHYLLPDGIAGSKTLRLLELTPTDSAGGNAQHDAVHQAHQISHEVAKEAMHAAGAPVQSLLPLASQPIDRLSSSDEGLRFIYIHEAQRGVSNHLHWPGGKSGVTLGPGYDMSGRSAQQIATDLISIGVNAGVAKQIGDGAAGLTHQDAADYAGDNKNLVNLSHDQEMKLLALVVPAYEDDVKQYVDVDLFQTQFDALVSFDYNCGPGHTKKVAHHINKGEIAAAMKEMKKVNTSGGEVVPGLVSRRDHEVMLYLYGKYAKHAK